MTDGLMGKSQTIQWGTPTDLFELLNKEFNFNLDVCASDGMNLCERYFNPEIDGLKQEWTKNDICWMNPPYGKEIKHWVKKASLSDAVVVALLPARTDTKWWNDWVMPTASELRFIRGRLKFNNGGGPKKGAPFPSVIAIYNTPRTPKISLIDY